MKSCETCSFNVEREFNIKRCKACSRTERAYYEPYEEIQPNAAVLMERFIEAGLYGQMKAAEERGKQLKTWIRTQLETSDEKRHEFQEFDRVAKFVAKNIYEWDYEGLNECLDAYGLLPLVASIDQAKMKEEPSLLERVAPFALPPTFYVKPTLNKAGKEWVAAEKTGFLALLVQAERRWKHIQMAYEQEKRNMLRCPELRERRKLTHRFGNISLVANATEYDMPQLYVAEGADFLIRHTKPNMAKLNSFIERRLFPKAELDLYRRIIDIRLDFVVMSLSEEQRLTQQFRERKVAQSLRHQIS
jgi:hypothetical protein